MFIVTEQQLYNNTSELLRLLAHKRTNEEITTIKAQDKKDKKNTINRYSKVELINK